MNAGVVAIDSLGGAPPPSLSDDFDLRLVCAIAGRNWLQFGTEAAAAAAKNAA